MNIIFSVQASRLNDVPVCTLVITKSVNNPCQNHSPEDGERGLWFVSYLMPILQLPVI